MAHTAVIQKEQLLFEQRFSLAIVYDANYRKICATMSTTKYSRIHKLYILKLEPLLQK